MEYFFELIKALYSVILLWVGVAFIAGYGDEIKNLKGNEFKEERKSILIKRLFIGVSLLILSYLIVKNLTIINLETLVY